MPSLSFKPPSRERSDAHGAVVGDESVLGVNDERRDSLLTLPPCLRTGAPLDPLAGYGMRPDVNHGAPRDAALAHILLDTSLHVLVVLYFSESSRLSLGALLLSAAGGVHDPKGGLIG
jgi:hypothetical protein